MTALYWENEEVEVFSALMEESASWFGWWLYGTVHMIKLLTCCISGDKTKQKQVLEKTVENGIRSVV